MLRSKRPFRGGFRCPLCSGAEDDPRGQAKRCDGWESGDGWIHCTRRPSRFPDANGRTWAHPPATGSPVFLNPERAPTEPDKAKRERRAWAIAQTLRESLPAPDPAAALLLEYLAGRGLGGVPVPPCLRFHPCLAIWDDGRVIARYPAMLARVDNEDGTVTIHRTYLGADGRKAPMPSPRRLMSPEIEGGTKGAAIRIGGEPGHRLAVAEGIETAMAFQRLTSICTWACVSAGGLRNVTFPGWVEEVFIAADNDAAGLAAAKDLARRLLIERPGLVVRIVPPPTLGDDWNDHLLKGGGYV